MLARRAATARAGTFVKGCVAPYLGGGGGSGAGTIELRRIVLRWHDAHCRRLLIGRLIRRTHQLVACAVCATLSATGMMSMVTTAC